MEIVDDSKYKPFSKDDYQRLVSVLNRVSSHLPEAEAPFIWNAFNAVRDAREPQPCTCASSGAHWGRAVSELRLWLRNRGENF